jgi:hypothetical protein
VIVQLTALSDSPPGNESFMPTLPVASDPVDADGEPGTSGPLAQPIVWPAATTKRPMPVAMDTE